MGNKTQECTNSSAASSFDLVAASTVESGQASSAFEKNLSVCHTADETLLDPASDCRIVRERNPFGRCRHLGVLVGESNCFYVYDQGALVGRPDGRERIIRKYAAHLSPCPCCTDTKAPIATELPTLPDAGPHDA